MRSVLDKVFDHAELEPERACFTLVSSRQPEVRRTFRQVAEAAGRAASFYRAKGVRAGEVVVLVGTHHPDFYAAWLGASWIGAVPAVLAEPSVRVAPEVYWARFAALLQRIDARVVAFDPRVKIDAAAFGAMAQHTYDTVARGEGETPARVEPRAEELMLLQHSSGTTGLQKGVMLTHGAVMRHAESYAPAIDLNHDDLVASWLPLYHDMGLIACFLTPLITGTPVVWLSPFEWVASPGTLLQAITKHKATLVWLPNFAYAFLAGRVREPAGAFDLRSLRMVINCSEPVTHEAMDAFAKRFEGDGFDKRALHACYAMAENVFAVSSSTAKQRPIVRQVEARVWREEHRAKGGEGLTHVSNGPVIQGCEVRIAAEDGTTLGPLHAGRILIRSSFLFDGYFRRDDLNSGLHDRDGFYDTGDLGYLDEQNHLYVTGRKKDLVIIGGRNVYPQDVEQTVMESAAVHEGRVVCFGVVVKGAATEGLVVLAESDEPQEKWPEVERAIRRAVPAKLDLDVVDARIVERGALRKSSSGKLARDGNRQWYLDGRFGAVAGSVAREEG